MKSREIIYEPHPVSRERKAELRAKGYKIIDARFAPEDQKPQNEPLGGESVSTGAGNAGDNQDGSQGNSAPVSIPDDWEGMHWASQEKLALEITGGDGPLVPAEGQTRADAAKAIIAAEIAKRRG